MLFTNRKPYEQGRRLGKKGLLQVFVRQACLGGGYWKTKKNFRKYRRLTKKKTPPQKESRQNKLILQAIVCGLDRKKTHLANLFNERNIHVALLQETLHKSCDVHITGYTAYPCKCEGCRGIITYIRNDIQGDVEHLNWHPTDAQKATLWYGNNRLNI